MFARSPQAFSPTVPVVSTKLVQDLLSFTFIGDSAADIKTGFHPFMIMDGNTEHRQIKCNVAKLYGYLQSGETLMLLADLEALQAEEACSVPVTYWELEKMLGTFGNLMGVVLGLQHPLSTAYKAMWANLQSGLHDDLHTAIDHSTYIKPVHALCSIQLQFTAGSTIVTTDSLLLTQCYPTLSTKSSWMSTMCHTCPQCCIT